MHKFRFIFLSFVFLVIGCNKKITPTLTCDSNLNLEALISELQSLPDQTEIREVVTDYYSESRDYKKSYLTRSLINQNKKTHFQDTNWLLRQKFLQDCKTKQIKTGDGFVWDIQNMSKTHISIRLDSFDQIEITFDKTAENSLIVTQKSRAPALNYFYQQSVFRWGDQLPSNESLNINFIFGLYSEGLEIPNSILEDYSNLPPHQTHLPVSLENIYNLQNQIDKILGK